MNTINKRMSAEKLIIAKADIMKRPVSGVLELLPLCNMNCAMCYVRLSYEEMKQKGRLRTLDEWMELARQMQEAGVLYILLTGGEPLLYPEFKELYLALRKMGMIVSVNTNGTLIDDEWVDFFVNNKPRKLNVTIYGGSEDTYEKLCHYRGGYAKTINAIQRLIENDVHVKINYTVTKYNFHEIAKVIEWAKERALLVSADTYMIPVKRERERPFDMQSRLMPKEAAAARVKCWKLQMNQQDYERNVEEMKKDMEEIVKGNSSYNCDMTCHAGSSSFTITWDGKMMPCLTLEKVQIDVFEKGFENAWKYIVDETMKIKINSKCANCEYRSFCRTCTACAIAETGDNMGIPEYMCEYAKESFRLMS